MNKTHKPKLKSHPPVKQELDILDIDAFVSGAGAEIREVPEKQAAYPWESPKVREDMIKVFNLRLSEPYFLKLRYISEHSPDSMHSFCLKVLLPAIDKEIKERT